MCIVLKLFRFIIIYFIVSSRDQLFQILCLNLKLPSKFQMQQSYLYFYLFIIERLSVHFLEKQHLLFVIIYIITNKYTLQYSSITLM